MRLALSFPGTAPASEDIVNSPPPSENPMKSPVHFSCNLTKPAICGLFNSTEILLVNEGNGPLREPAALKVPDRAVPMIGSKEDKGKAFKLSSASKSPKDKPCSSNRRGKDVSIFSAESLLLFIQTDESKFSLEKDLLLIGILPFKSTFHRPYLN